ncbi:polybromo-1 protein [Spatholobus suberectus]|nr:polybromo-1 protein [Spatholobus suberectus]
MVNRRRFSRVATSDDEDEPPRPQRTRKRMRLLEEEDNDNENEEEEEEVVPEQPQPVEDAKPIGQPVRFSGKGRGRKKHYDSFEFDGIQYTLEDPVLLVPEVTGQKPYVAIIKDITQANNGNVLVTGQWFYRPEEAEKKNGGNWQSCDTRELFYSFHRDKVPAEAVMHKCVVHFVPIHKQLPKRKDHPGFIVQKVYDTVERKLWRLSDKDYEDIKQQEIDELVQKTLQRIGELLDIESEEAPADEEDQMKNKKSLRRKSVSPLDVSKEEEETLKSEQHPKSETPASCGTNASEYYRILVKFNALTGDSHRDKWLERLLQHIQYMCDSNDSKERDKGLGNVNSDETNSGSKNRSSESANDCQVRDHKSSKSFIWPDAAVSAIVALEKASHDVLSSDSMKYNQKLRQLAFNLQKNAVLARHLLNGELEPSKILNMTPNELKEGLVAEERSKEEPDETQHVQMIDARCSKCMDCKVGLREIIQAGNNERYQLECVSCGHSWYASRDEVSMPTIDASDSKELMGTAP